MSAYAEKASANKRQVRRKPVLLGGVLTTDKGATHFACTIRDLSDTGARVSVAKARDLPAIVHLVDVPNKIAYEAAVKWKRAPHYGLAFIQALPLNKPTTPLFLRKLWFERAR